MRSLELIQWILERGLPTLLTFTDFAVAIDGPIWSNTENRWPLRQKGPQIENVAQLMQLAVHQHDCDEDTD